MSNLGDLITNVNEVISPSIFNAKTIWSTSGTNLANHDINQDVGAVVVNESGSGFLEDHMYIRNKDKTAWVDVFKNHLHTSDLDGGSFFSIKQAICKNILELNYQSAKKAMFTQSGTGTYNDFLDSSNSYIELISPTGLLRCNLIAGGLRLFYGKPFTLQYKYKIFNNTNIIWRAGTGMSLVEASGNQNQAGFEGCLNTDARTAVISGDGTNRTPAYMSTSLQTNPLGLRMDFYPNDRIIATDGLGGLVNKTDAIPLSSAATDTRSTFRVGVKSTNDSAGDSRTMAFFAAYLIGHIYDAESGVGAWL